MNQCNMYSYVPNKRAARLLILGILFLPTSVAPELSSARLSSDSARAGDFSARLGSARGIFGIARLTKILLKRAICRLLVFERLGAKTS